MGPKLDEACPIWGTVADVWQWNYTGRIVDSARAGGRYRLTAEAADYVMGQTPSEKARLTTWIVDQHRLGNSEPVVESEILAQTAVKRPLRYREKVNRFLRLLEARDFTLSSTLRIYGSQDATTESWTSAISAWIEAADEGDPGAFIDLLHREGILADGGSNRWKLTPHGLEQLEEATTGGAETLQAFIAMWFNESLDDAFSLGIAPGVRDAGYEPLRIDRKEHANKIDDEIVAEIRRSRFVVADFTSGIVEISGKPTAVARGGVYYEAGFAQGLNLPVIWTVHADCVDLVHFDTRQYSHLVWRTPAELREMLYNRIAAVIGEAPGAPGRSASG